MKNSNQLLGRRQVEVANAPTLANEWPIARDQRGERRCGMACGIAVASGGGPAARESVLPAECFRLRSCVSTSRRENCKHLVGRLARPETCAAGHSLICIAFMTRQSHRTLQQVRGHGNQLCSWRQPKINKIVFCLALCVLTAKMKIPLQQRTREQCSFMTRI